MNRFFFCLLLLLFFPSVSFSQIYRARDYFEAVEATSKNFPRWEVSVGVAAGTASVRDFSGQHLAQGEMGADVRALYACTDWLSLGISGGVYNPIQEADILDVYRTTRLEFLSKFTLTPQASPRSYILAGVGWMNRKVAYWDLWEKDVSAANFILGLGVETMLSGAWFGGLEVRGSYNLLEKQTAYFNLPDRWEASLQLRTGFRF